MLKNKTISSNEKILFSLIYSLSKKEGYCFATNNYLANILNFHPKTISKWINNLEKKKIITIEYVKNIKNEITERKIFIPYTSKNQYPSPSNSGEGIRSTVEYNNIIYNNIHNKESQTVDKSNVNFCDKRNYHNGFFENLYANFKNI